jgi:hypothetical protein
VAAAASKRSAFVSFASPPPYSSTGPKPSILDNASKRSQIIRRFMSPERNTTEQAGILLSKAEQAASGDGHSMSPPSPCRGSSTKLQAAAGGGIRGVAGVPPITLPRLSGWEERETRAWLCQQLGMEVSLEEESAAALLDNPYRSVI